MQKRERAQKIFRLLIFFVSFVLLVDLELRPVSAQEASPTPDVGTPAGTQTLIPEIPTPSPINIIYPVHGLRLTGVVVITGSIALDGWTSYELAFAFANDRSDSWFVFAGGRNPLAGTALGSWKTTAISDGDYNLRLRVFSPGSFQDGFVYGLRVRNYTPDTPVPTLTLASTVTPEATATPVATAAPTFTPTVTLTIYPSPTALPPNPATLGSTEIVFNLGRGALLIVFLFGVFGLFVRLRHRP